VSIPPGGQVWILFPLGAVQAVDDVAVALLDPRLAHRLAVVEADLQPTLAQLFTSYCESKLVTVCSVAAMWHSMRGRQLGQSSPQACGDWLIARQTLLSADNQMCATSLRPVHRTWPTSMEAVFRRLAHGVYTMPTLFSLHP
jgi:hypothetical protein